MLLQGGREAKQIMCLNAVSQLGSGGVTCKKEKPVETLVDEIETSPGSTWGYLNKLFLAKTEKQVWLSSIGVHLEKRMRLLTRCYCYRMQN